MKSFSLLLSLAFVSACASPKIKELPPFDKTQVCSESSLKYIDGANSKPDPLSTEDMEKTNEYMNKISFVIKECYDTETQSSKKIPSHWVCLVTGNNKDGKRDFFEFSSKNNSFSPAFWDCLGQIETTLPYPEYKNVSVLQSFKLYPKY